MSGLICVAGGKGAPGATTFAVALASWMASSEQLANVTLVDADPDGGDVAPLLGISTKPGLVTLAAASRHGFDPQSIELSSQTVPSGFTVLSSPSSGEQASSALETLGAVFAATLAVSDSVADVGRWRRHTPTTDLVAKARVTMLVIRPTVSGVAHARHQLDHLAAITRNVEVVCLGDQPYETEEVATALGISSVWDVAVDRRAAAMVGQVPASNRWLRRSALMRSVAAIGRGTSLLEQVA